MRVMAPCSGKDRYYLRLVRRMAGTILGLTLSRSSGTRNAGPPGEAEILALNPAREQQLRKITGWQRVEPGTLNVYCVEAQIVSLLEKSVPAWQETGEDVIYPENYRYVPLMRKSYLYYLAQLQANGQRIGVLARRAEVPVEGVVELFANVALRTRLKLSEGNVAAVRFFDSAACES